MEKNVVVTGAGDSVGRLIAERYLAQGAKVHICDVRKDAVAETLAANPGMHGTVTNVGKPEDVEQLFKEVFDWMGHVTILVNMVGIAGPTALLEDISLEEWRDSIDINLNGMFYTIRQVVPEMKKRRNGCIVNFSSASTRTGLPKRTPYVVSKYGVEGLTRNLARELGPFNIRCNAILPGGINNERVKIILRRVAEAEGMTMEEVTKEAVDFTPMRTLIEPAELADMVLFLTSDAAPHISGQLIGVDGNHEWER
ncbi:MAG: SDR family oxidoreductase [Deltaproteobacteria bacterium]|nr:SDR family oxidoreductase [Deltaproteobacteria bacterium]